MSLHVILATLGSSGDVNPFIAIGRAMVARGHRATLVTNPHFETAAREAGLDFAPIRAQEDYVRITKDPDLWHPRRGLQVLCREVIVPGIAPTHETIERLNTPGQTVVLAHGLAFGARIAHETSGVPLVTLFPGPLAVRSLIDPPHVPFCGTARRLGSVGMRFAYRVGDFLIDRVVLKPTNAFRRSFGLPPVRRLMRDWWMSPQRVIGVWPDWFAPPQPDWYDKIRVTGFVYHDTPHALADTGQAEAIFSAGQAPVLFTPGTAMRHGRDFFAAAAEACRLIGRPGVLLTPFAEQIPDRLPDGVVHLPFLPFGTYLPRAGAIVHHGGVGTVAQAMSAGIPQVVRPMGYDQFDNGHRVERLGVGVSIRRSRFRARRVAEVLDGLLSSRHVAERCRDLASRIQPGTGAQRACEAIEGTAGVLGVPTQHVAPVFNR
ncbi:MAG: glycosyltransferase [Phycisphaerae bacterium]